MREDSLLGMRSLLLRPLVAVIGALALLLSVGVPADAAVLTVADPARDVRASRDSGGPVITAAHRARTDIVRGTVRSFGTGASSKIRIVFKFRNLDKATAQPGRRAFHRLIFKTRGAHDGTSYEFDSNSPGNANLVRVNFRERCRVPQRNVVWSTATDSVSVTFPRRCWFAGATARLDVAIWISNLTIESASGRGAGTYDQLPRWAEFTL